MDKALKNYTIAAKEYIEAQREDIRSKLNVKNKRSLFMTAKQELHAVERELLDDTERNGN